MFFRFVRSTSALASLPVEHADSTGEFKDGHVLGFAMTSILKILTRPFHVTSAAKTS